MNAAFAAAFGDHCHSLTSFRANLALRSGHGDVRVGSVKRSASLYGGPIFNKHDGFRASLIVTDEALSSETGNGRGFRGPVERRTARRDQVPTTQFRNRIWLRAVTRSRALLALAFHGIVLDLVTLFFSAATPISTASIDPLRNWHSG